jgi:hypothetical protein
MRSEATLRAGDWVEVRSREEILTTLDNTACLESMPFMPEMLRYSGQRFRVYKRAHRTCDTVDYIGGRHLKRTVHLEGLRCDGSAHGDCQALCLLFWKEAWLQKVDGPDRLDVAVVVSRPAENGISYESTFFQGTRKAGEPAELPDPTYVCQATKLLDATVPLRRSDLEPYIEDLTSGNVRPGQMLGRLVYVIFSFIVGGRYGLSTPLIWLYDTFQNMTGGTPYPERLGKIPKGAKTPSRRLDLQPGEMVRVRSLPEILETIDVELRNRGMTWHSEMVQFTGRTFRVARRIEKIINEKTGKMMHMKNDAVILENAVCLAKYINNCRRFCPRSVFVYFREIWLERVAEPPDARGVGERDASSQRI